MVLNRKLWPQGSQICGSCVLVFTTVTSLQESALRSVDMFSGYCSLAWARIEKYIMADSSFNLSNLIDSTE